MFGSYRILRKLGEGGMGAVYLAEHPLIGKQAAIKVLLPALSQNAEIVNRFFNEARATTLLKHPGVVDIFDFGQHGSGSAYIIMEFLEGESLAACIRRVATLPPKLVVELARQVGQALALAHQKGIVHRDLKPDNVYLVAASEFPGGVRTKLLDFGIAKLASEGASSMRTRTGAMMGTPTYMSPEQCRGAGAVDHRSDIYSLGCMMFEMLAGRPPFVGEGVGDVIASHIFEPPPSLSALAPAVPAALAQTIARMLAKKADERYARIEDVLAALDGGAPVAAASSVPTLQLPDRAAAPSPAPRSTTLGSSAAELFVGGRPSSARWLPWVALGAVAIIGAPVAFFALRPAHAQPVAAPPVVAAAPAAAPTAAPAAVPTAAPALPMDAPAPARVTFSLASTPVGADVFRAVDGVRVGKTPFHAEAARSDGEAVYIVKLAGYADATATFAADHGGAQSLTLTPSPTTRPPAKKKKKLAEHPVLDPFADQ